MLLNCRFDDEVKSKIEMIWDRGLDFLEDADDLYLRKAQDF